jgi:hypothetical protein
MDIQELTRELAQNYKWNHDIEWGYYKIWYVKPDGTKVWTDDPQEVYIEYKQLKELDKKRDEITKQLIIDSLAIKIFFLIHLF